MAKRSSSKTELIDTGPQQGVCEAGRKGAVQRDGRRGAIADGGSASEGEDDREVGPRRPG